MKLKLILFTVLSLGLVASAAAVEESTIHIEPGDNDIVEYESGDEPQAAEIEIDWEELHATHDHEEYRLGGTTILNDEYDFDAGTVEAIPQDEWITAEEIENEEVTTETYLVEEAYTADDLEQNIDDVQADQDDFGLRTSIESDDGEEVEFLGFKETTFSMEFTGEEEEAESPEEYNSAYATELRENVYEQFSAYVEDIPEEYEDYNHLLINYVTEDDEVQIRSSEEGAFIDSDGEPVSDSILAISTAFLDAEEDGENIVEEDGVFRIQEDEETGTIAPTMVVTHQQYADRAGYVNYMEGGNTFHELDLDEGDTVEITNYYYNDVLDPSEVDSTGNYVRDNYDFTETQSFTAEDLEENPIPTADGGEGVVFEHPEDGQWRYSAIEVEMTTGDTESNVLPEWSSYTENPDGYGNQITSSEVYSLEEGENTVEPDNSADEYFSPVFLLNGDTDEPSVTSYTYDSGEDGGAVRLLLASGFAILMVLIVVSAVKGTRLMGEQ